MVRVLAQDRIAMARKAEMPEVDVNMIKSFSTLYAGHVLWGEKG